MTERALAISADVRASSGCVVAALSANCRIRAEHRSVIRLPSMLRSESGGPRMGLSHIPKGLESETSDRRYPSCCCCCRQSVSTRPVHTFLPVVLFVIRKNTNNDSPQKIRPVDRAVLSHYNRRLCCAYPFGWLTARPPLLRRTLPSSDQLFSDGTGRDRGLDLLFAYHYRRSHWVILRPHQFPLSILVGVVSQMLFPRGFVVFPQSNGCSGRIRTCDKVVNSHLLYR